MSKKIIINVLALFTLLLLVNCQVDGFSFGDIDAPTNLKVTYEIIGKDVANPNGDGSGKVKFTATADNALSYRYIFVDEPSSSPTRDISNSSGFYEKLFSIDGVVTYTVNVIASGKGGVSTNTSIQVTVLSNFKDEEAVTFLTGNSASGVKWYWAQSEAGHLGVGRNTAEEIDVNTNLNYRPTYYAAPPDGKLETCLYNSIITFSQVEGKIQFNLDNQGQTLFNKAFNDVINGSGEDNCYNYDTSGTKSVFLTPSESFVKMNPGNANGSQTRGTVMNFSDGGFMGYYVGTSSYEILSITANRMEVRCVDGRSPGLAWYHIFTTTPPGGGPPPQDDFTNLKWSDEFNVDGAPDPTKWTYDIGRGNNGWGNGEEQYYTNRSSNVKIEGGNLVITAKKENFTGASYTSARIKTQGIYSFTYGKVEARIKMPIGGGTWPAVWSLGSNITTVGWPNCGEIDFMEHVGNNQNRIFGSLHYPGFSGGNSVTGSKVIANASAEFHDYKVIWNATNIRFFVDNVLYFTAANSSTLPFNSNFFLIMNVAMGGLFGGDIDPAFVESSMEVDYIRVYQ